VGRDYEIAEPSRHRRAANVASTQQQGAGIIVIHDGRGEVEGRDFQATKDAGLGCGDVRYVGCGRALSRVGLKRP
jgi:hypothetical protein